jgi:D-alanyl-lipoteichoic acid acyltransferase DltB (MBOAT superfamily)
MTFTSFNFLLFFPIVVFLYNFIPQKWRIPFLLLTSYVFYISMQPVYAVLLAGVTITTYLLTRGISKAKSEKTQHRLLVLGIIVVLLPLAFYKYFNFINETIQSALSSVGLYISMPHIELMLPVGISFYTFMAISYIVDVYNEEVEFEPNILVTGLHLSFFPIVLSGPIERADNMMPQFKDLEKSTYEDLVQGFKMMLLGYFMKLCIADRIGIYTDMVYHNISLYDGVTLAFAALIYPFRVYTDFAGYSSLALGVARCMGIRIMINFKRPFFATSVSDFWQRWHISLIKWLTDYIYTPLSFMLRSWKMWGIMSALMVTFIVSGIWHGAAFTFIFWGGFNGLFLCMEAATQKQRALVEDKYNLKSKWWYILFCCLTVYFIFAFSQIFGRCESLGIAFSVIGKIFSFDGTLNLVNKHNLLYAFISLFILFVYDFKNEFFPKSRISTFSSIYWIVRYVSYVLLVIYILSYGALENSQFIYFKF